VLCLGRVWISSILIYFKKWLHELKTATNGVRIIFSAQMATLALTCRIFLTVSRLETIRCDGKGRRDDKVDDDMPTTITVATNASIVTTNGNFTWPMNLSPKIVQPCFFLFTGSAPRTFSLGPIWHQSLEPILQRPIRQKKRTWVQRGRQ